MLLVVKILKPYDGQRDPKYLRFAIRIHHLAVRVFEILLKARELEDYGSTVDLHILLARGEHNKLSF